MIKLLDFVSSLLLLKRMNESSLQTSFMSIEGCFEISYRSSSFISLQELYIYIYIYIIYRYIKKAHYYLFDQISVLILINIQHVKRIILIILEWIFAVILISIDMMMMNA